jgi:hypothetical protein
MAAICGSGKYVCVGTAVPTFPKNVSKLISRQQKRLVKVILEVLYLRIMLSLYKFEVIEVMRY